MTGWVAEIGAEAGFLPRHLTSGGAAVCVWAGGEGEIPHDDADAGGIRWVPGGFLLLDVQPLPSFAPFGTFCQTLSENPLGTTYTYGAASGGSPASLDQVTHSDGTPAWTVSTRDRMDRPLNMNDQAAGNRSFKYTRHGALEDDTTTSGILAGQRIEQDFDSWLRPRTHTASFGSQPLGETTYQYGPSGAVRSVGGNSNTASYFYHPQKRALETVTYTPDRAAGPILQSTRKYDAANRLTRITAHVNDAGVQKPIDHHAYDYDALDHIQRHTGISGASWNYGYNATGELTGATKKLPGDTSDYFGRNYRYHYDGIGNRTSVEQSREGSTPARVYAYTPNALNQYTTQTHPGFVEVSGTANPLAAVMVNGIAASRQSDDFYKELSKNNSAGPRWIDASITDGATTTNGSLSLPAALASPVHDDDGNLTSDGLWIYHWDAENRLIGCERSAAAVAAGAPYHREEHVYDSLSRRIQTTTFANNGTTPSSQTLYVFDGWKCVAELDGNGQPIRTYTWGLDLAGSLGDSITGNVGALLWLVDTASNNSHIALYDKNGNVSGLIDSATRKRSATYDYDAFGQLITCYGEYAKSNPFTFSTKFTNHVTGLCYYGYRWYDPKEGRWLSKDPIEEEGGINLYGFVQNDGVANIDKLGLALHAFDGTWNDREQMQGHTTNVAILYEVYASPLKYYYVGVGTSFGTKLAGGLTGAGGLNRVSDAMCNLKEQLKNGDRAVDIIGFSRGAAEAREFANRIARKRSPVTVRFMGLFDTVASIGIPGNGVNPGYDLSIGNDIKYVFQATANDERRTLFPLHSIKSNTGIGNTPTRIEIGFPGAHSDVGGGYEDGDLSDGPLMEMWKRGKAACVPFRPLPAQYRKITNGNPHHEGGPQDARRRIYYPTQP